MQYARFNRLFLPIVLFLISALYCAAQSPQQNRIAILSFTGGTADERDGIAELFSFRRQIMQNFTVIPRTSITSAIAREQSFQSSGMTNSDTMARLGNQVGANYVMAGSITSLGSSNLLIVSVVKIDVIQQVAGDFITYKTLDELVTNPSIINGMAERLITMMQKNTGSKDKLAVVPVEFSGGASRADGDALAQVLSIHLINNGKYAVYPRTQSLDQVQNEYKTQQSGVTRDSQTVAVGRGTNPEFVLSIVSRRIGDINTFNASIIALEGGNQIDGLAEQYANLTDGINAMDFVAKQLSGIQVTERERSRRTANVSSTVSAAEREAARQEREAAREERKAAREASSEAFLSKTSFIADGWVGLEFSKKPGIDDAEFSGRVITGGGLLGFEYDFLGLQTGLNVIGTGIATPASSVIPSIVFQVPVLARLKLDLLMYNISVYGGVGFNVWQSDYSNDIEVVSESLLSGIVGMEMGLSLSVIGLNFGFQYNADFSDNVVKYNGEKYKFKKTPMSVYLGLSFYAPLRK